MSNLAKISNLAARAADLATELQEATLGVASPEERTEMISAASRLSNDLRSLHGRVVNQSLSDRLIHLLKLAGHRPRPYGGYGMMGRKCISVDGDVEPYQLAMDLVRECSGDDEDDKANRDLLSKVGSPGSDPLGTGWIVYWKDVRWPDGLETEDDETEDDDGADDGDD